MCQMKQNATDLAEHYGLSIKVAQDSFVFSGRGNAEVSVPQASFANAKTAGVSIFDSKIGHGLRRMFGDVSNRSIHPVETDYTGSWLALDPA